MMNISRRHALQKASVGFGMTALAGLMADPAYSELKADDEFGPRKPHFEPKAKNVIFCYMSGGVSQVDSFDPKPRLDQYNDKEFPLKMERTQFNQNGKVMASPWKFKNYGESGLPVSDLFPEIGSCADDLAVVRSLTADFSEHAQGNFFAHTGFPFMGYPSAGAWTTYGLGSEARDLPGFVVLRSGGSVIPHGGVGLFSNGFLPAIHQASLLDLDAKDPVSNIRPKESDKLQRGRLDFINKLDRSYLERSGNAQIESAIKNYEMAYQMQSAVPELVDLSDETEATKKMYGFDSEDTQKAAYARQCLLARRLVERGVRFVELTVLAYGIGGGGAANPWDNHGGLPEGHKRMAFQVDQPIGALLKDLKQRDLLKDTLVLFTGEFGRTPFSQGSDGRDHNPYGFSIWMAGGGVKGGTIYGATDEFGYHAVENKATIYDMWATVLHQLGLNHADLTYRHGGRDIRLTDVHGNVIRDILS